MASKANNGYIIYRKYRTTFETEIANNLVPAVNQLHENQLLSVADKKAAQNTSVDKNTRAQNLNKILRDKIQGSEQFFRKILAALDKKTFPIIETMAKDLEGRNPPPNTSMEIPRDTSKSKPYIRFGKNSKYTSGDSSYEHSTVASVDSSRVGSVKSQSNSTSVARYPPVQSQGCHYVETTPAATGVSFNRRLSHGIVEGTESIILYNSSDMGAEDAPIQQSSEHSKDKIVVMRRMKSTHSPSVHRRTVGDQPRNDLSYEMAHLDELDNAIKTSIKRVAEGCSEIRPDEQRIESGYKRAAEHYKHQNEQLQLEINELKQDTKDVVEYKKAMAVYKDVNVLSQKLEEKKKDIKRLTAELQKANAELVNIKTQLTVKKYAEQKGVESKQQLLQEIDDIFPQLQKLQGQEQILHFLHDLRKKALMLRDRPSTA